jgi:hypothetical protein
MHNNLVEEVLVAPEEVHMVLVLQVKLDKMELGDMVVVAQLQVLPEHLEIQGLMEILVLMA